MKIKKVEGKTREEVLNGLDVDMIEYVNYSIDTIDLEKAKWLKGRKINLKDIALVKTIFNW